MANKRITDVDFIDSLNGDESFFINRNNSIKQISKEDVIFSIANGGTGATNADAARTNLGAAAANHTHTLDELGAADENHTHTASEIGAAELDENGKVLAEQTSSSITDDYTLTLNHAGKFVKVLSTNDVTIIVPSDNTINYPVDTEIEFCQLSDGITVTFAPASGVELCSINGVGSQYTDTQFACVALKKLDSNQWLISGALA